MYLHVVRFLTFCLLVNCSYATEPSFQGLGPSTLGPPVVGGISDDGQVVVGGSGELGTLAFRWTSESGFMSLGDLPGGSVTSWAEGASADGTKICGSSEYAPNLIAAIIWDDQEGMSSLGVLPGGTWSSAAAISDDGSVIVGIADFPGGVQAFRWNAVEGMVGLGYLPGGSGYSEAFALSGDGSVIWGSSDSDQGASAFRWTVQTGMIKIEGLSNPSIGDTPCGSDVPGLVTVGGSVSEESDPEYEAYRWTMDQGPVGLGDLPGGDFSSIAAAVSGDGEVVVGTGSGPLGERAFIWTPQSGMRAIYDVLTLDFGLDLTGWRLTHAAAVSSDGEVIVGTGLNPFNETAGWIAVIPRAVDCGPEFSCDSTTDCTYGGLSNTSVGESTLSLDGDCNLVVDNIGASGANGVSVDVAGTGGSTPPGEFRMEWLPLVETSPAGAFVKVAATGTLNGEPYFLGSIQATRVGPNVIVVPDYTPIGSQTQTIGVFLDGNLVQEISGHTGSITVLTPPVLNAGCGKDWEIVWFAGRGFDPPICFSLFWSEPVLFDLAVSGAPILGDEIRVLAESPSSPPPDELTDFTLTMGNITKMVVTSESSVDTSGPISCEGDANGDGEVDPLDSGYILSRLGCPVGTGDADCDAADVNLDHEVDPLDSGYVLARFGTCP